ncbi:MerR family transcriptional regulator [Hymenobacter sp. BT770]|uniref:MerR family transcriptional regulator n=1 Tax=Hymenobacter sp. BT770 TaxID=2886942 RepID=UPI001D10E53D|nr:MerR family transcriptional regulator [Hymenobacter sp. BT770]MCC3153994.1 MerR family transcriptional regulator [Hymenobacter sp. BT770]MDO3416076.1 MerR family transcriptional regulator [Hymenobacter sp. BT770]
MGHFSISDLEQLSGIKAHTIRMWEQRYGLLRPVRTATNIRLYCDDDLRRLLNVTTLCGRGKRISQVACLSDAEIQAAVLACGNDAHDYQLQVNALLAAMLTFDEVRLNQLLDDATSQLGFENMMLQVAYPLLQRIGLMWLAGTMNLSQEHLLSHLLRQKLLAATDALPPIGSTDAPRWLLFLPEHELHELALLFMNYTLRSRGQHTLYLGQNMPIKELTMVCQFYRPNALVTVLTTQPDRTRIGEFAQELLQLCPVGRVVLYGNLARQEGLVLPPNFVTPPLMTDFLAMISENNLAPVPA